MVFLDADRPHAPQHPPVPPSEGSAFLVAVHDHLRADLAQVVRAVGLALQDRRRAADARALVADLTSGLDPAAVGSFCRRWCRVVEVHHRIEDAAMFPELAQASAELRPVLDRLSYEHEVVHELLVRLDGLLVELATGGDVGDLAAVLDDLRGGLLSHLDYEEAELLQPIARLGIRV